MKTKLLILIMVVFLIGIVSSQQQSIGPFKQLNCVELPQICPASSYSKIYNVQYPNTSYAMGAADMSTTDNVYYNYSNFCNTSALGRYIVSGHCDVDSVDTGWAYDFEITADGTKLTVEKSVIYIIFTVFSILLWALCLMFSIKIPFKNQRDEEGKILNVTNLKYIKIFFIVMTYVIFMFLMGLLRGITAAYIPEIGVHGLFEVVYWIMLSFLWPLAIVAVVFGVIFYLSDKKIKKYTNLNFK